MRAGGRARRALRHGPLGLGGTLEGWCGARESLSSPAQVTRVASRLVDGRSGDASGAGDASGVRRRKWWRQRLVATQRGTPAPMARCTCTQGRRAPRARPGCAPAPPLQPFSYSLSSTRQLHHILSDRNYYITVFLHLKGQKFRGDARLLCARYPRHQVQRARHQGAYSARLAPSTAAPDVVCLLGRGCGAEAALRTPEAATRESA